MMQPRYLPVESFTYDPGPCSRVLYDCYSGQFMQELMVPHDFRRDPKAGRFAFKCTGLCHLSLHRPHLHCLFNCSLRKALRGKIPKLTSVAPYCVLIRQDQNSKWRSWLIKRACELLEFCAWR